MDPKILERAKAKKRKRISIHKSVSISCALDIADKTQTYNDGYINTLISKIFEYLESKNKNDEQDSINAQAALNRAIRCIGIITKIDEEKKSDPSYMFELIKIKSDKLFNYINS